MSMTGCTSWSIRRSDITREFVVFANYGSEYETSYTGSPEYIAAQKYYPPNAPPEPVPPEIVSAYRQLLERG